MYVHTPINLSAIPEDHQYQHQEPVAKEMRQVPEDLKCDFMNSMVKALVRSCIPVVGYDFLLEPSCGFGTWSNPGNGMNLADRLPLLSVLRGGSD